MSCSSIFFPPLLDTWKDFLKRLVARLVIVLQIFYTVYPSWAWAYHDHESFSIELSHQDTERNKHTGSSFSHAHTLKVSYHHQVTQGQKGEWAWNLAELTKEPQETLTSSEDTSLGWSVQNTSTGILLAWQGSKTSTLQFRINSEGDMFLERMKGCFHVDVCSPKDVSFSSSYYESLQNELGSYGLSVVARNITQTSPLNVDELVLKAQGNLSQDNKATLEILKSAKLYGLQLYLKGHLMADGAQVELEGKDVRLHGPIDNENILNESSLNVTAETLDQKHNLKLSDAYFKSETAHFHGTLSSDKEITFEIGTSLITDEPLKARSIKAKSHFLQAKATWQAQERLRARAHHFDGTQWFSGNIIDLQSPTLEYEPSNRPCSELSLKGKSISILDSILSTSLYLQGLPLLPKGMGSLAYLQDLTLDLPQGCHWDQPLSLPGFLKITLAKGSTVPFILESPLRANKGMTLKSYSQPIILDQKEGAKDSASYGSCESAQGGISVIAPALTIRNGHIVSQNKLLIHVLKLASQGRIHSATLLEAICEAIELQEAMTSDDTLILETGTILYGAEHIFAKNLAYLRLKQGGTLEVPITMPGFLKVEVLREAKNPLTILTELSGDKGLDILCWSPKLILGQIGGSKAVLKSPQGKITIGLKRLNFLHGNINGYKGIGLTASDEVIHGLERGKEKTTARNISYSGMSNGRSMSGAAKVAWLEFSPCHWRSDAGDLSVNAPWIEFNGGSIWSQGLTYTAPLSSSHPSCVIHNGVTLDVLGDGLVDARFFYHGPYLHPFAKHRQSLQAGGGFGMSSGSMNHLIPASDHSTFSLDGNLTLRVRSGRCVGESTLSYKGIVGKDSLRMEGLVSNLHVENHPHYTGQLTFPTMAGRERMIITEVGPVHNEGHISAPYIQIPFTQLYNGPAESSLVPVKLPERNNIRPSLMDQFSGQGGADCCPTGPYALAPMLLPASVEENLAPRVFVTPNGFTSFPSTMRPLCDPLTESRLVIQKLIKSTGCNYLPGYESLTPWQTYALIRHLSFELAQPWLQAGDPHSQQDALFSLTSQKPAELTKALMEVAHPILCYIMTEYSSSSITQEQVGSPQLFFPSKAQKHEPQPGPGVISGKFVALEGTPTAPIKNRGHLHAGVKGLLTGHSMNQVKILDYGKGPALALEDYQGREIIKPTPYQLRWGGDITGDTWEWHLEHMTNTLGMVHVDNLWADLHSHYNSGRVVVENLCIWDVRDTHQERLQRFWQVITYHERTKKSWWGLCKDTEYWTQTHNCSESYPAPLSGYFHAGTLRSGPESDTNDIFPHRDVPLEATMERYVLQGGKLNTGAGGMSMVVRDHLQTIPNVSTSLEHFAISRGGSFRSCSEKGAVQRHSIVVPAMVSEGPLQWSSYNTMSLQSLHAKVTRKGQPLSFKARREILLPDFKVWQEEVPYYEKKGKATYLVKPFHEVGAVPTFENPHGSVRIISEEAIRGVKPRIHSLTQKIDAPALELYQQILRQECQIELIDSGQVDPCILALVSLAATLASAGTLAPYTLGILSIKGTATAAMVSAGIASLSSQVAVAMVANQGNIQQALKDLTSIDALRSFATTVVSAGLCHEIFSALEIPMNPALEAANNNKYIPGFTDFLESGALKAAIDVPLNIGIGGQSASKALLAAAKDVPLNAVAAWGAYNIGDLGFKGKISPLQQDFAHAGFHGILGAIQHPDQPVKAGITAGANAFVASRTSRMMFGSPDEINEQAKQQLREEGRPLTKENINSTAAKILYQKTAIISLLNASATALITRDPSMVATSIFTTTNVTENNCIPSMTKSVLVSEGYKYPEKDMKEGFWQDQYADADDLYFQRVLEAAFPEEKPSKIRAVVKRIKEFRREHPTFMGYVDQGLYGIGKGVQYSAYASAYLSGFGIGAGFSVITNGPGALFTGPVAGHAGGSLAVAGVISLEAPLGKAFQYGMGKLSLDTQELTGEILPLLPLLWIRGLRGTVSSGINHSAIKGGTPLSLTYTAGYSAPQRIILGKGSHISGTKTTTAFFEMMNMRGEANITDKIFAFARDEHGGGNWFGKATPSTKKSMSILDGGVPSPVNLNYNVLGYPNPQRIVLGKLYTDIGVGYSNKTVKGKYAPLIEKLSLHGKNPLYARLNRYGKFEVHTEIAATFPEEAARNFFSRITGQKLPMGCVIESLETPGGKVFVFRKQGDSGHPKVELTYPAIDIAQIINEKITFKQKELKIVSHTQF